MPHISQKRVKKKTFKKISDELVQLIADVKTSRETKWFLDELLTETERVMFAKRLALIVMLKHGYSFRTIQRTLKVSLSTVERFWKRTQAGSFMFLGKGITRISGTKKSGARFWKDLEDLLFVGAPKRAHRTFLRLAAK